MIGKNKILKMIKKKKSLTYKFSKKFTQGLREKVIGCFYNSLMSGKMPKITTQAMATRRHLLKRWADAEKNAEFAENCRRSALKRIYSKSGYSRLQKHCVNTMLTSEGCKNKRTSYKMSKERRKQSSLHMLKVHEIVRERKNIEVRERPNDYCGVLTEEDFETITQ